MFNVKFAKEWNLLVFCIEMTIVIEFHHLQASIVSLRKTTKSVETLFSSFFAINISKFVQRRRYNRCTFWFVEFVNRNRIWIEINNFAGIRRAILCMAKLFLIFQSRVGNINCGTRRTDKILQIAMFTYRIV